MKIIKNIILLSLVIFSTYFFAEYFVKGYYFFYPTSGVGSIASVDFTPLIVLPLEYIFFVMFLFTAFGDSKKYWWIGFLLIPAIVFELYFDLEHIYIPIAIGLIGWVIGFMIPKILAKFEVISN